MKELRNLTSKEKLRKRLAEEAAPRVTISFYRYHPIENPPAFRDELFAKLSELEVLGRIYVAREGINGQVSVPEKSFEKFKNYLYSFDFLSGIRLNTAISDDGKSFYVLKVKARPKIVADGIDDPDFSLERRGEYLKAKEFNELAENPDAVLVDMRNHYEYEVGHFENALEIPADTFREQLPAAVEMLADKKEKPVIMYCTGGIRCEKASAYLLHRGFKQVFHLEGGIIEYARQVKKQGLENKFRGRNFVFDERMGEQIGGEIISRCLQCGEKCATHVNCANLACHMLFLQCENCREAFQGCCGAQCQAIFNLPPEEQKQLRKGKQNPDDLFCNSRRRRRKT